MEPIALLSDEDFKKFAGQYVCVAKSDSKKVIASGKNPSKAIKTAKRKGFDNPLIFYVLLPGEVSIPSVLDCS
ncbi:hypothetical protein HY797_00300 [Candidatus Falkowbacteria bacterium]|nr:hypothetical protein [Candidatus Falkowbacteria bacterium]